MAHTLTLGVRPMFCMVLNSLTQYPLRPFQVLLSTLGYIRFRNYSVVDAGKDRNNAALFAGRHGQDWQNSKYAGAWIYPMR